MPRIPPFHWWRTVFFLIPLISVYSLVLGALSIGSSLFDSRGNFAHVCARIWSWLILATTGVRVHVRGREGLRANHPYVFVSNHQSIYDIPIIFASLPYQLRIIAKESLGNFPIWGWHLRRTGHLLVNRRHPGAATLRRISALMGRHVSLIVFPEGTRSIDGRIGPFKPGIFLLAIKAGLPIVPLSVSGSRHVMRKGRLTTCPGDVELIVHEPIATTSFLGSEARALGEQVRQIVSGPQP